MLNNFNMDIVQRAAICGSLREAIHELKEEKQIDDYEDIIELLHPIVLEKLKMEYYVGKCFPDMKIQNSLDSFS